MLGTRGNIFYLIHCNTSTHLQMKPNMNILLSLKNNRYDLGKKWCIFQNLSGFWVFYLEVLDLIPMKNEHCIH